MGRRGTPFPPLQFMAQYVPPPQMSYERGGTVRGTLGNAYVTPLWSILYYSVLIFRTRLLCY